MACVIVREILLSGFMQWPSPFWLFVATVCLVIIVRFCAPIVRQFQASLLIDNPFYLHVISVLDITLET